MAIVCYDDRTVYAEEHAGRGSAASDVMFVDEEDNGFNEGVVPMLSMDDMALHYELQGPNWGYAVEIASIQPSMRLATELLAEYGDGYARTRSHKEQQGMILDWLDKKYGMLDYEDYKDWRKGKKWQ